MLHDGASGVVALPEPAVEDRPEPLFQLCGQCRGVASGFEGPERLVVTPDHAPDVLRTAGASLDFQDPDPRRDHLVEEIDRAEILGREDVASVDVELRTGLLVRDGVFAAAQLAARAAVGRAVRFVEREVALARNGHAQGAVGEHLDLNQLAPRTADLLPGDLPVYFGHLLQRQFARQDHRVGPLGEEPHRLGIGNVALGGDVHLLPDPPGVEDRRQVRGDHGIDAGGLGPVDHGVHLGDLVLVDDGVDRQVAFHAGPAGRGDDLREVVEREVGCRGRAHVEFPDPEVDGVGSGLNGGRERFVAPDGSHYFDIRTFHRFQ